MSDIDKIRQEIERLRCESGPEHFDFYELLDHFKDFIDSLPEEKPSEDLEEAADKFEQEYFTDATIGEAFIEGAKWQANQLLKGSPLPEDTVVFQKGIEEGKRLMMEEAADGEIGYWNQSGLSIRLDQSLKKLGYDMDTKVKIIIVKQ